MPLPSKILIKRMEDYPTHYLGKTSRGLRFWAYETFVFSKPYHEIKQGEDWRVYRKEDVVLHKFNRWGKHLGTGYWLIVHGKRHASVVYHLQCIAMG